MTAGRTTTAPATLVIDSDGLARARARSRDGDVAPAIAELRRDADLAAEAPLETVTSKTSSPSGDPHDYVSLSIYYWPDPAKTDGLPYVSRDGDINPEIRDTTRYDAAKLFRLVTAVETLALAAYLTGEPRYADAAARRLRTWYLDAPTRMNPTLRYAQIIPGKTEPRGTGIMDGRQMMRAVDAALVLGSMGTTSWTAADQRALRAWFGALVDWLRTSENGRLEASSANNHACWYDAQLSVFALFAGREDLARETIASVGSRRVAAQLSADGAQPHELTRTRSYHYSVFNVLALTLLADLGRHVGVDVWSSSGARLRRAIDLLVPHAQDTSAWPYPEHPGVAHTPLEPALVRAARAYPNADYADVTRRYAATLTPLGRLRLRLGAFGDLGGAASAPPR
jgi:hypothetical protein